LDIETAAAGAQQPKLVNDHANKPLPSTSHYKPGAVDEKESQSLGERLKAQATPAVRKLAKEYAINLALVKPSGPKGRITKEDVLLYVQQGNRSRVPLNQPTSHAPEPVKTTKPEPTPVASAVPAVQSGDQRVPIRGVQRLMVKSMTAALQVSV
jgi:pyruvate/2-oxoglutarate dehydrogenase complex dihydrolipoamide acyltransferase (E2) component